MIQNSITHVTSLSSPPLLIFFLPCCSYKWPLGTAIRFQLNITHFTPYFIWIEEKLKNNTYMLGFPCHFDFQLPEYWSHTFWHIYLDAHWLPCHLNFLRLPFQHPHWLLGHMAIYKLLSANYHSRKPVISHTIVMSKSLEFLE